MSTGTSCNTPWQWSMNISLKQQHYVPCPNVTEYLRNHFGIKEIIFSDTLWESCLGTLLNQLCDNIINIHDYRPNFSFSASCKVVAPKLNSVKIFDEHVYAGFFNFLEADDGTTQIILKSSNKPINVVHKVWRVDINTFVSSIGGSMGLFLGFSIYTSLLATGNRILKYL